MITYEWKIEWYDAADLKSADIIDTDHFDSLSELLDAVETRGEPCQVCLVRDDDKTNTRAHLYFFESALYDEEERGAPLEIAIEIARKRARIAALVAGGLILTDDQIGACDAN